MIRLSDFRFSDYFPLNNNTHFTKYLILVITLLLHGCDTASDFDPALSTAQQQIKYKHQFTLHDDNNSVVRTALPGQTLTAMITVTDQDANPVSQLPVSFALYRSINDTTPMKTSNKVQTDSQGKLDFNFIALSEPGIQKLSLTYKRPSGQSYTRSFPVQIITGSLELQDVRINDPVLSLNAVTSISAKIYSAGNIYRPPVRFALRSDCSLQGKAIIDSPIIVENGELETIYHDNGCGNKDRIEIYIDGNDNDILAEAYIDVKKVDLGKIYPLSVSPPHISLKKAAKITRLSDLPKATFQITDAYGAPLENKKVLFTNTARNHGVTVSPLSASTDQNGKVSVNLRPGNSPVVVRAIAIIESTDIRAESPPLAISSGVPFAGNSSIRMERENIEFLQVKTSKNRVYLTLRDEMNYPVDEDTPVEFYSELGRISSSAVSNNGTIRTLWVGSGSESTEDPIVTIIAVTKGSEGFNDLNNNQIFDKGDSFIDSPEPYIDYNRDGTIQENEFYLDLNQNGQFDLGDGRYNGIRCLESQFCSPVTHAMLTLNTEFMISTSRPDVSFSAEKLLIPIGGQPEDLLISISDLNGNYMPQDTTITLSANRGNIIGKRFAVIPGKKQAGPYDMAISISSEGTSVPITGLLTVSVQTPAGIESRYNLPLEFYNPSATALTTGSR